MSLVFSKDVLQRVLKTDCSFFSSDVKNVSCLDKGMFLNIMV